MKLKCRKSNEGVLVSSHISGNYITRRRVRLITFNKNSESDYSSAYSNRASLNRLGKRNPF